MSNKFASLLLASALVLTPSFVMAQSNGQGRGQEQSQANRGGGNGGILFRNRGECQSALSQIRNTVRRATVSSVNRVNPLLGDVCRTVTGLDEEDLAEIPADVLASLQAALSPEAFAQVLAELESLSRN